jgi:hypothetical protein
MIDKNLSCLLAMLPEFQLVRETLDNCGGIPALKTMNHQLV